MTNSFVGDLVTQGGCWMPCVCAASQKEKHLLLLMSMHTSLADKGSSLFAHAFHLCTSPPPECVWLLLGNTAHAKIVHKKRVTPCGHPSQHNAARGSGQSCTGLAHVPDQPAPAVPHAQVVHEERDPPVRARHGAAAALHGHRLHLPPLRRQRRRA